MADDKYDIKITVPKERPTKFLRSAMPLIKEEKFEEVLPRFLENLNAMRMEIFMGTENERKVATFMPGILLNSWHAHYLKSEPDHSELAQIQHNWKKSTATATECLKEGLVCMGVSISFVFMLCFFMVVRFMIVFSSQMLIFCR